MFDIDQEHPEYTARKAALRKYRDLYAGGEQFKANAAEYLIRRQREPGDVYGERLSRVFYENYVGSIVDWYAATLFRREPIITFTGNDPPAEKFFAALAEDADRRETSLGDFFRRQFIESLVAGTSYALVDFPRVTTRPGTRAEEDASGASRAYLVEYAADDVINWSLDEHGNFDWVVIRTKQIKKDRVEDPEWRTETRWAYYDKQTYRVYVEQGGKPVLVDEGRHGLAKLHQTPLYALRIPEGLWMLNRAGSLQLEHFNKSNALGWALTMGLFAMPVVYSERDWNQMVGESYYIQLGPEDKFGWTEPEGKVYQIAADNLTRLQEEIYRVCYLSQAGASMDVTSRQSGLSKQRDFSITQEVLRAYTFHFGVGLALTPIPQAPPPALSAVAGPFPKTVYYVRASWTGAGGQEGAPSEMTTYDAPAGALPVVQMTNPPAVASGFNVYMGLTPDAVTLQNDGPVPIGQSFVLPGTGLVQGRVPGDGQAGDIFVSGVWVLQRG